MGLTMRRLCLASVALLLLLGPEAHAIDGNVPTISSAADITTRRNTLINQLWGTTTLPSALSSVTQNIGNSFPGYNVARVDRYVASMSNGQTNTSNFYLANSPNNNRVVILNPGHQNTCDWTAFSAGYRVQPVLQALLAAGYSVFAMNMPGCGTASEHISLLATYGNAAMRYFFEPAVQAMNYWDTNFSFRDYNMAGLSGGGWTTTILPALDTRIKISIPVAGSWPGIIFAAPLACADEICGDGCDTVACAEQNWTNFFTVAGYIDLYMMASYGPHRLQFQILNYSDGCCFGNSSFVGSGAATFYGVDFPTYIGNYIVRVKQQEAVVMPVYYDGMIDYVADQHQISPNAQSVVLSILGSTGPGGAGGGRRLFHMW
jgi:pimeloyl-ACP methyl ester carboxylesterase